MLPVGTRYIISCDRNTDSTLLITGRSESRNEVGPDSIGICESCRFWRVFGQQLWFALLTLFFNPCCSDLESLPGIPESFWIFENLMWILHILVSSRRLNYEILKLSKKRRYFQKHQNFQKKEDIFKKYEISKIWNFQKKNK